MFFLFFLVEVWLCRHRSNAISRQTFSLHFWVRNVCNLNDGITIFTTKTPWRRFVDLLSGKPWLVLYLDFLDVQISAKIGRVFGRWISPEILGSLEAPGILWWRFFGTLPKWFRMSFPDEIWEKSEQKPQKSTQLWGFQAQNSHKHYLWEARKIGKWDCIKSYFLFIFDMDTIFTLWY